MPKKQPPKAYHHGSLREALVAAGTELLAERGAEGLTLRECARRAGVSHAAPKHHFATLDDLLAEIAARGYEEFVARLGAAAGAAGEHTPRAHVIAMGKAYLKFAAERQEVYGLMFGQKRSGSLPPRLADAAMKAWQQIRTAAAALGGEANAELAALQIWSQVHGLALLFARRGLPLEVREPEAIETILERMCNGLSPQST